jgi:hypothetical protein
LLLLRHLADRFDSEPERELTVFVAATAAALGLGTGESENAPLLRSFGRLVQFDLALRTDDATFAVRRNVPPVNTRHVRRLPADLQARHAAWVAQSLSSSALELARRRARRVAFTLYELGDDVDAVERALHRTGFPAALCRDAARWGHDRHRAALEAAATADAASAS